MTAFGTVSVVMAFGTVLNFLYRVVMLAGSVWCHQRPERSPHLWGAQMPLCWRCTGVFAGTIIFFIWLSRKKRLTPLWLSVALALPMPLDVLHAVLTGGEGDNTRRLVTGLLWGVFGTGATLHLVRYANEVRLRTVAGMMRKRYFPRGREVL